MPWSGFDSRGIAGQIEGVGEVVLDPGGRCVAPFSLQINEIRMAALQDMIDGIGADLVTCSDCCTGIWRDQSQGIVPRSLFLDRAGSADRGCFAVGLNPGTSRAKERTFYLRVGMTYDRVKEYRRSIDDIPYFQRARTVIDLLGLRGPIIWSNLAKCENAEGRKDLPPVQTMRHCAGRFLRRELEVAPPDWAVLAIGRDAFMALAYVVPKRAVIGIPHTTGAYQDFRKTFENGRLRKETEDRAAAALSSAEPGAAWLGRGKQGG
jgi:hypothetical protein